MKYNAVAFAIARGVWAIDKRYIHILLPQAISYIKGENKFSAEESEDGDEPAMVKQNRKKHAAYFIDTSTGAIIKDDSPQSQSKVAVIPIRSTIMKNDYCGIPGTATMRKQLRSFTSDPSVVATILIKDTPGGSVDGTKEFADEIAIAKRSKPVLSFIDGLDASAGVWISSPCTEIIASSETAEIGSIGTMCSLADDTKFWEEYGITWHDIYADASKHKNKDYYDALKGDYKGVKEILNPLNDIFLNDVKTYRAGKLKEKADGVLSGKVFLSQLALENGLIDSIGNFDYAVQRAIELADSNKSSGYSSSKKSDSTMKKFIVATFPTIAAFLGIKEDGEFTEEHMTKVEGELATHTAVKSERDKLKKDLEVAQTELENAVATTADLNTKLTAMTTKKDKWKAEAKKFGAEDASEKTETAGAEERTADVTAKELAETNKPFEAELEKLGM